MKEDGRTIETLLGKAGADDPTAAGEVLRQLFPKVTVGNQDRFYRELRVCHTDVFDRYFLLSIPENDVSQTDLDALLASTGERARLVEKFNELKNRGLLGVALNRFEAYKQEVSLDDAVPFIAALFDIGDELPKESVGTFDVGTWMHASRIIRWYLMKEPDKKKRQSYLADAIGLSDGLYLPVMKVALETDAQREGRTANERLLDDTSVENLKALCIGKIRVAAATSRLSRHSELFTLLGIWMEWANPEEARTWVEQLTQSYDGVLVFLQGMTLQATSSGAEGVQEAWYMQLSVVEKFIDPRILSKRLGEKVTDGESEPQRRAVKAFREALDRRDQGKRDGAPWRDWNPEK